MSVVAQCRASFLKYVKPRRLNQYMGTIFVSLSGFAFGVTLAWNSSAGDTLRNVLNATGSEIGLVGGILNGGACGGLIALPFLLKCFNRINAILLTLPIYLIGWVFIILADQKVWSLICGRFICGLAGGVSCVVAPLFIGEIADKNCRVRLLTYFQLLLNCGMFYAFFTAFLIEETESIAKYSLICAISCAPIVLVGLLHESPLYYLINDNESAARSSMRWYRGQDSEDEIEELKGLIKRKPTLRRILLNFRVLWNIFLCYLVMIIQQLSGINTVIFYAAVIFNNGGSGELSGSQQTLVVGIVQVLACYICTKLIDVLGRRILLVSSSILTGLFMILQGWYMNVRDNDPQYYEEVYGWMPPTWIALFFVAFNLGLGPISWSILGDTFPNDIKTYVASSVAFLSCIISLVATFILAHMAETLGVSYAMWIFGGTCCIGGIFCGTLIPETNGKSLVDIENRMNIQSTQVEINES